MREIIDAIERVGWQYVNAEQVLTEVVTPLMPVTAVTTVTSMTKHPGRGSGTGAPLP